MPRVANLIPDHEKGDDADLDSEKICLHLPSDFTAEDRQRLDIKSLTTIELKLRKAEANDALKELRTQLNFMLGLEVQKGKVRYTKNLTRATRITQEAGKARDVIADTYRSARRAIISLGGDGEKEFPSLSAQDMKVKSMKGGRAPDQQGKVTDSWIYKRATLLTGDAKAQEKWDKEGAHFFID
jgi:hypothetical protein